MSVNPKPLSLSLAHMLLWLILAQFLVTYLYLNKAVQLWDSLTRERERESGSTCVCVCVWLFPVDTAVASSDLFIIITV